MAKRSGSSRSGSSKSASSSARKGKRGAGRPYSIPDEQLPKLREIVLGQPTATLDEISMALERATGIKACRPSLRKAIERAGIERSKPKVLRKSKAPSEGPRRYGYEDRHRDPGSEERYPSCFTDAEWELVGDLFETPEGPGKPPLYEPRLMADAVCYVVRTGCSWRQLPKDFPPWNAAYKAFRRWADRGIFEEMHDRLRSMWRRHEGRRAEPTGAVLDSQSVRTSEQGGPKGYDAGKKIRGRKRNLVVDTLGMILAITLLPASIQDRDAASPVVAKSLEKYPTIQRLYVDAGYAGRCKSDLELEYKIDVEVVRKPQAAGVYHDKQQQLFPVAPGFQVLPKRWVVERTNAWNMRSRRLQMDHDRRMDVGEAWIWLVEARILSRRLTDPTEIA